MKKKLLFTLLVVFSSFTIYSQDTIVKTNGERVLCKILKEDSAAVFFTIKINDHKLNTYLNKSEIGSIKYDTKQTQEQKQNNQNIRELGISFNNTSGFGIKYKFGNENLLFRISALSINGSTDIVKNGSSSKSVGLDFSIGIERIKPLKGKLNLYYGAELIDSYSYQNSKTWTVNSGIGLVLGLLYKINDNLNLSAEIIPAITYSNSANGSPKNIGISGSTSGANITIAYRF